MVFRPTPGPIPPPQSLLQRISIACAAKPFFLSFIESGYRSDSLCAWVPAILFVYPPSPARNSLPIFGLSASPRARRRRRVVNFHAMLAAGGQETSANRRG